MIENKVYKQRDKAQGERLVEIDERRRLELRSALSSLYTYIQFQQKSFKINFKFLIKEYVVFCYAKPEEDQSLKH